MRSAPAARASARVEVLELLRRSRAPSARSIFAARPESTLPGPTSSCSVAPPRDQRAARSRPSAPARRPARAAARARVGAPWCRAARRRSRSPARAGRVKRAAASSGASFSMAGAISSQWNGADTSSATTRFAPAARHALARRPTPHSRRPAITVCTGELKFAGATTPSTSAQISRHVGGLEPEHRGHRALALRAPLPASARRAGAPAAPRRRAASRPRRRAPRTRRGCGPRTARARAAAAARRTRQIAIDAARIAGCVISVRASSLSGPLSMQRAQPAAERGVGLVERGARLGMRAREVAWPCRPSASPVRGRRRRACARVLGLDGQA